MTMDGECLYRKQGGVVAAAEEISIAFPEIEQCALIEFWLELVSYRLLSMPWSLSSPLRIPRFLLYIYVPSYQIKKKNSD